MVRNRTKSCLAALLPILLLLGCEQESPLSNTEISDPSLLTVRLTVKKIKTQSTGSSNYVFQAELLDRKARYIELLNGHVYLNGIKMFSQQVPYENVTRYRLYTDAIKFRLDSLYTFTIVLSDGASYSSSVRTPATDMFTTTAMLRNDSIVFSWAGNAEDSIEVFYETLTPDAEPGTVAWWFSERIDPKGRNTVAIKPESGREFTGTYSISTFRSNTVDPSFRGGYAKSMIELKND